MASPAASSPFDSSSSNSSSDRGPQVQLPLEEPVTDLEEAVRKLRTCSQGELERARKHHQRALKALGNGAYDALSEGTREQLLERLHTNLEALNKALEQASGSESAGETDASTQSPGSSSLRRMFTWLW